MKENLTKQQKQLLFRIKDAYSNNEYVATQRHLELFSGCGYTRQARELERKGYITIEPNSNSQMFLCLKGQPYQLENF